MSKKMLRLISTALALLMLCGLLAACTTEPGGTGGTGNTGNTGNNNSGNTDNPGDSGSSGDDGGIDYLLQVPQEDLNATITILARQEKLYEIDPGEDEAVSTVEQAVFNRNARVEEYLNVDILNNPVAGNWSSQSEYTAALDAAVASGDDMYQLAATQLSYSANIVMNDKYYNLYDYDDSINLSGDWWPSSWVENGTINETMFHIIGDISLTMWEEIYAVYFNRQMAYDREDDVGDLYQIVRDGGWTLELLTILAEEFHQDLDSDAEDLDLDDMYGLLTNIHSIRSVATSSGLTFMSRNDEGTFDLVFMDNDHSELVESVYADMYQLIYETQGVFARTAIGADANYEELNMLFTGNQAMFYTATLAQAQTLRHADMKFGILPMPKYDYDQENYMAHVGDDADTWGIPLCCVEPGVAAKVLDAMSAESKTSVVPVYYEIVLQGRVAQDPDSAEMLDLIRQELHFDFGYIYSNAMKGSFKSGPFAYFGDSLRDRNESMAAAWASCGEIYETEIVKLFEKFYAN